MGLLVSRLPRQRSGPTLLTTTRLGFAAPVAVGLLLQAGLRLWLLMDIPAPCRAELALSLPFGPEFLGRLLGQGLDGAGAALLLGLASPASPARHD